MVDTLRTIPCFPVTCKVGDLALADIGLPAPFGIHFPDCGDSFLTAYVAFRKLTKIVVLTINPNPLSRVLEIYRKTISQIYKAGVFLSNRRYLVAWVWQHPQAIYGKLAHGLKFKF